MFRKVVFIFSAQALFANIIFAQCYGNPALGLGIGNGIGLSSNGIGLTSNGLGLTGNGIGLTSNGIGLTSNGIGLTGNGIGYGNIGLGPSSLNTAAASNSGFTVTSSSPIAPSGVSMLSEYVIEGPVNVGGQLPLLGAVALEGHVPTSGSAGTQYSCGNGNVGIVSETGSAGIGAGLAGIGAGLAGVGAGLAGIGAGGIGNRIGRLGGCTL